MKKRIAAVLVCGALFVGVAFAAFSDFPEEPVCYFGNCAKQIRDMADEQTDMFMKALNGTINEFFEDDENEKVEFSAMLKRNLGLGDYVGIGGVLRSPEEIKRLEKLKKDLEPFEGGAAKFMELAPTLRLPVAEGEGK